MKILSQNLLHLYMRMNDSSFQSEKILQTFGFIYESIDGKRGFPFDFLFYCVIFLDVIISVLDWSLYINQMIQNVTFNMNRVTLLRTLQGNILLVYRENSGPA